MKPKDTLSHQKFKSFCDFQKLLLNTLVDCAGHDDSNTYNSIRDGFCLHQANIGGIESQLPSFLTMVDVVIDGYVCFEKFPSSRPEECIEFIKANHLLEPVQGASVKIFSTGGGAHHHEVLRKFRELLKVEIEAVDELASVVRGLNAMLRSLMPDSLVFRYNFRKKQREPVTDALKFPYLLVNCGSGTSIMKVESENTFTRVSGTSLGGGTFLGLCRGLTKIESFDEIKQLYPKGDNTSVDLLVGDIYGGDYQAVGLPADVIASSCGKIHAGATYKPEDQTRSLLRMISNNTAQIVYDCAVRHQVNYVIFTGFFVRDNEPMWHTISYGFDFWSKGQPGPMFVSIDGFLGAMGAFVHQFRKEEPSGAKTPSTLAKPLSPAAKSSTLSDGSSDKELLPAIYQYLCQAGFPGIAAQLKEEAKLNQTTSSIDLPSMLRELQEHK